VSGAFAIGIAAGLICLWGVTGLKRLLKADDSLDVFGVHAVGGISGALLTGIFNSPDLGGPGSVRDWAAMTSGYPGIAAQFLIQLKAVAITAVWSGAVAFVAYKAAGRLVGLRVTDEEEREGLDIHSHGESAYDY
jgi:Amt family ammonium transporter